MIAAAHHVSHQTPETDAEIRFQRFSHNDIRPSNLQIDLTAACPMDNVMAPGSQGQPSYSGTGRGGAPDVRLGC